jgi:hypothetical protein
MPFLLETMANMTMTHFGSGILEPWKIVPVSTEDCFRHLAHFQTRRMDRLPCFPVAREPDLGFRK